MTPEFSFQQKFNAQEVSIEGVLTVPDSMETAVVVVVVRGRWLPSSPSFMNKANATSISQFEKESSQ